LFVIGSVQKRLVDEVRKNDTLIIVGETGSGKTTCKFVSDFRFPLFCNCFLYKIVVRRV
jgi:HrpA-like RNA helicase